MGLIQVLARLQGKEKPKKKEVPMKELQNLVKEAEMFDLSNMNSMEPEERIVKTDRFVGTLSEPLRRLYAIRHIRAEQLRKVCEASHDRMKRIMKQQDISAASDADRQFATEHILAHKRQDLIDNEFWQAVREEFPLTLIMAGDLTIRKDFKVVMARPVEADVIEALDGLIGALVNADTAN